MSGYVVRQATQIATFILLARLIGVEGFGAFTASLAVAAVFSPFVEMGGYSLVVRDIERGDSVSTAIGSALKMSLLTLPIVILLLIIAKVIFLSGVPWLFFCCIFFGEIICNRIISISAGAHVSMGLASRNAIVESLSGITRLLLVFLLGLSGGKLLGWGLAYFLQSILMSVVVIVLIYKTWGKINFRVSFPIRKRLGEGMSFAFSNASQTASGELDKVLLSGFGTLSDVGIFSAAQRIVNVSNFFLFSLLTALYPKFFSLGRISHRDARSLSFKLLPITLVYALFVVVFLNIFSPYLSNFLGDEFDKSIPALKMLAFLSILNAIHYPFADALTGAGKQTVRTQIYIVTLIVSSIINIIFIPKIGWMASIYAGLVSQSLLCVFLLLYVDRGKKGEL